ncbi:hypothetical protein D5086_032963 [Populus alba]|uniref:Uncharacterized protein n=1 Tax=Populus alba TaxID=43335 RepID=A0ACC4AFH2_POPAL
MIPFLYPLLVDSAISRRIIFTSDQIGVLESSTWMIRKVPSSHLAHCNQSRFTGNERTIENEILELAMLRRGCNSHGERYILRFHRESILRQSSMCTVKGILMSSSKSSGL